MDKIDRSRFLKKVKENYPELSDGLNAQEGLITFEVSIFIGYLQKLINDGETTKFVNAIELASYFYVNGNEALKNSIRNGICEDLHFEDSKKNYRSWAIKYLPIPLAKEREVWLKFMGYNNA